MSCPTHNVDFILKPAGVSKRTGKPYEAFWACPTYMCNEKPVNGAKAEVTKEMAEDQAYIDSLAKSAPAPEKTNGPDWDAKERRMVRMNTLKHATELYRDESMSIEEKIKATKALASDFESYVYQKEV